MKILVGISLFIFWAVVAAVLTAGLVFYQSNNLNKVGTSNNTPSDIVSAGEQSMLTNVEVAKHNSAKDCWLIINNKVYNISSYLGAHPGGASAISPYCGGEATRAFATQGGNKSHSSFAGGLLAQYYIGDLNQKIGQQQLQQNIQNAVQVKPPVNQSDDENEVEDD